MPTVRGISFLSSMIHQEVHWSLVKYNSCTWGCATTQRPCKAIGLNGSLDLHLDHMCPTFDQGRLHILLSPNSFLYVCPISIQSAWSTTQFPQWNHQTKHGLGTTGRASDTKSVASYFNRTWFVCYWVYIFSELINSCKGVRLMRELVGITFFSTRALKAFSCLRK